LNNRGKIISCSGGNLKNRKQCGRDLTVIFDRVSM
jgi:hypothetical protein